MGSYNTPDQQQHHVLMVSFPGQGHINPLLRLANRLASKGLFITFSTTLNSGQRMLKSTTSNEPINIGEGQLGFEFFSDGYEEKNNNNSKLKRSDDIEGLMNHIATVGRASFTQLIKNQSEMGRLVSCIINNAHLVMERSHHEVMGRLREAALRGNVDSLRELLDEDPLLLDRIIVDDCNLETPLHIAAMRGHVDFAREILNQNKEIALEQDGNGRSPLHLASAKGNVEMVKLFLLEIESARTCKLRDALGRTPLHVAAMKGRDHVLMELLGTHHECTSILTYHKETILHLATKHGHLDTLKQLLHPDNHYVAELLNSKDVDGNTILHVAVLNRQTEMVKYLVGGEIEGLDINVLNNHGCTPMDVLLQSRSDWKDVEINEFIHRSKNAVNGPATNATIISSTEKKQDPRMADAADEADWLKNIKNGLLVTASLIVTVTFQASLTPVGGFWSENKPDNKHLAGMSILASEKPLTYAIYCMANTTAFMSSNILILLLISVAHVGRKWFIWLVMSIMWIAVVSLGVAYFLAIYSVVDVYKPDRNIFMFIARFIIFGFLAFVTLLICLVPKRLRFHRHATTTTSDV